MTQPTSQSVYQLVDVNRSYGRGASQVHAVRDVSLVVDPGDRLGIVGESGSGKSTLIRMMAALDRPTSGQIRFRGTDIARLPERQLGDLRASVQMVFQDPRSSLNPRMTVGQIITEGLRSPLLRQRDDIPVNHDARLREVMEQVGLPASKADAYPHEFSGGQRQRIAIARALAPKPDVLIADEPVSALDVSVRAHVLNLLRELVAEYALTMVFVSHDLTVVRHVCDRVAVLRHGEVVETGGIASVYDQPRHPYTQELLAAVPRFR
ncbi:MULTISPECIES: ABC transporter ATP-binding protein [unclassified Luteococcus]|uniref:ABC transporter ATP-binding protein n=1 Tax=unclassified Luteococcus TaxID=2639923 RepID=UPI00313D51A9